MKVSAVSASFVRFLVVGILNTAVGLGVIFLAKWLGGLGDVQANLLGYLTALSVSFLLNSRWSFVYRGPALPAMVRFFSVIAVAYLLNLATVLFAIHALQLDSYFAQTLGIVPYTLFTYVGARHYAFRYR
jgi:putative flippase GtrA